MSDELRVAEFVPPSFQKNRTAFGEVASHADHLERSQSPVDIFEVAFAIHDRNDLVQQSFLIERVRQFPFHPHGFD